MAGPGGGPPGRPALGPVVLLPPRPPAQAEAGRRRPTSGTGRCSTWPGTTHRRGRAVRRGRAAPDQRRRPDAPAARSTATWTCGRTAARSCGCWIYSGVYADEVNQAGAPQAALGAGPVRAEWGWTWPLNRRVLYNRASADPQGRPWSERKALVWWDAGQQRVDRPRHPGLRGGQAPGLPAAARARSVRTRCAGDDPFIMMSDGKAWLFAPTGLADGPLPTHYEPHESPVPTCSTASRPARSRKVYGRADNPSNPSWPEAHRDVFPYVFTAARLTEHHTAGGMSRTLPYLSELQPALFVEVSPELARSAACTTWTGPTSSPAAPRWTPGCSSPTGWCRCGWTARSCTRCGCPTTGAQSGLTSGDVVNDLIGVVVDPNVFIQESKVRPATSSPAGVRGDRPCWTTWPSTGAAPASPRRPARGSGRPAARRARRTPSRLAPAEPEENRMTSSPASPASTASTARWTTPPRTPAHPEHPPPGRASSPTPRSASAARPARWPARSGTTCPRTGSTCWACRSTTPACSAPTPGGTWRSSSRTAGWACRMRDWRACPPGRRPATRTPR